MMGLSPLLLLQVALDVVYEACKESVETGRPLLEAPAGNPKVSVSISTELLRERAPET